MSDRIVTEYTVSAQNHDGSFTGLGWFDNLIEAKEAKAAGLAAKDWRGVNTYGNVWITEFYTEDGYYGSRQVEG